MIQADYFILTSREVQFVFNIMYNNSTGTAFLYAVPGGTVLITAAHVIRGMAAGDRLFMLHENIWRPFDISAVAIDPQGRDIAAFTSSGFFMKGHTSTYPKGDLSLGCRVNFLGFPHGLAGNYPGQGFATPLVRTAFFSGVTLVDGYPMMILDGFNNPGFSGGPVFGPDGTGNIAMLGLISSYRYERKSQSGVYQTDEDGEEVKLQGIYTKPNSGMIYVEQINDIERLALVLGATNPAAPL